MSFEHAPRAIALSLMALVLISSTMRAQAGGIEVGQPARDFKATTFDGRTLRLADYKGHVLIVNLWATWCVPCRQELPLLNSYYQLRKDVGLDVIALATENSVPEEKLKPLAAHVSFPFVRSMRGPYIVLGGVPTNYVIDRHGIVRYAEAGGFTLDLLNELLIPLLKEPVPQAAVAMESAR